MSFHTSGGAVCPHETDSKALRGVVIATHGVGDSAASLADIATHFGHEFRVYLVDLLGHGHAPRLSAKQLQDPFASVAEHFERDLVQIINAAPGGVPVIVMGHSFGGAVAAHVARRNPQLIDALVLEDPALLTEAQAQRYRDDAPQLVARMHAQGDAPAEAISNLIPDYPAWSTAEYTGWAQAKALVDINLLETGVVGTTVSGVDGEDILPNLSMPTLLLTGDGHDVLFGAHRLEQALTSPVSKRLVEGMTISGASHTVRRDKSAEFFAAVDSFLDRVLPREAVAKKGSLHGDSSREPKAFIRPDLKLLADSLPPQTTWDAPAMRASGEARHIPHRFAPGFSATQFTMVPYLSTAAAAAPLATSGPHAQTVRVIAHDDVREGNLAPELVFFCVHGGGYVGGKPEYDDVRHEALVREFHPAVAISPEYRLSPEHPYPAGVIDTIAALAETVRRYPDVPIIAYGDSAGAGTLAQAFARLEDFASEHAAELRRHVKSFIAVEPCLDPAMNSASWTTYAEGPVWYQKASAAAWAGYMPDKPPVSHLMPVDKSLVPPTLVVVNPADPLRDEGIDWARRLTDSGVNTELHMFSGTLHGLTTIPGTPSWESLLKLIADFNRQLI